MASEILAVSEENLLEVINIIRTGLKNSKRVSKSVRKKLTAWCNEEEAYMKGEDDET